MVGVRGDRDNRRNGERARGQEWCTGNSRRLQMLYARSMGRYRQYMDKGG